MRLVSFEPTAVDPHTVTQRRVRIASIVLFLTVPAVLVMADLDWRTGFDAWKALHLSLFTVLFALLAFGLAQAWMGFVLRRRGGDPLRIVQSVAETDDTVIDAPTAVIMPICNEEVARVMEGMKAIYESVAAEGKLARCDFFLLSDSRDPNHWIEEEAAWLALCQKLDAHGRIFYRKRRIGINKKAGNVADFCRRWGSRYQYMIVLDADSLITGAAVNKLVRLMEHNPKVGLIQAVPVLVNGETILARVQQFASRLYGPIFSTGLNYWQLGEANYWGHNAIIRVQPFMRHCSLPELPGDGPFGGRILSHDYVEAALMRRAGWQVWLATDLPGNYEECPPNLVEFAQRDRRWLQGNLQHTRLIFAGGFHPINRLHFILGILSYLASPLWLIFILLSCVIAYRAGMHDGAAEIAAPAAGARALSIFGLTLALLFAPKVLALLDLRGRPQERAAFGGWRAVIPSVLAETFIFTLVAPLLMLFHTKFVMLTLARRTITWGSQRRGAAGESQWTEAMTVHAGQTFFGVVLAVVAAAINPALAWWMSPLLAGMILAIPISYFTGAASLGRACRREGLFLTPEETEPAPQLVRFKAALDARAAASTIPPELAENFGLSQAVLDPYVNATHVSLLRAKDDPPTATAVRLAELRGKLLADGPESLSAQERLAVLADPDSMSVLHETVWATPLARLARWWRIALDQYRAVHLPPRTAFDSVE